MSLVYALGFCRYVDFLCVVGFNFALSSRLVISFAFCSGNSWITIDCLLSLFICLFPFYVTMMSFLFFLWCETFSFVWLALPRSHQAHFRVRVFDPLSCRLGVTRLHEMTGDDVSSWLLVCVCAPAMPIKLTSVRLTSPRHKIATVRPPTRHSHAMAPVALHLTAAMATVYN